MRSVPSIDEDSIKEHVDRYERYVDLCEKKKALVVQFKEIKKQAQKERVSKVDNQNQMFKKINADIECIMDGGAKENINGNNY